jgi:hypothetical protein
MEAGIANPEGKKEGPPPKEKWLTLDFNHPEPARLWATHSLIHVHAHAHNLPLHTHTHSLFLHTHTL